MGLGHKLRCLYKIVTVGGLMLSFHIIISATSPGQKPKPVSLPRPLLPQNRTFFDKFVDYLLVDGPQNRYALICKQCHSHNGMALKEEFEYFSK